MSSSSTTSSIRNILRLGTMFFFIFALGAGIYLSRQTQNTASKAATNQSVSTAVRGKAGDLWADIVLGHVDFNQATPNETVPFKLFNPLGTIVDRTSQPNTLYVYDGANSRVVGHAYLGYCRDKSKSRCNSDADCNSSKCYYIKENGHGKSVDIVLGQPSATGYSACNQDGNIENYPVRKPASKNTMCSTPPDQISPMEGGSFASMAVDADGNLYVPDFWNSRILKFKKPLKKMPDGQIIRDTDADQVWGQDDFTGTHCNKTHDDIKRGEIPNPNSSTLCFGTHWLHTFGAGVDIDPAGNLWVADVNNNRVLRFPKKISGISQEADLVLGQKNFNTRFYGEGFDEMNVPSAVRVNKVNNKSFVYVADTNNKRVLIFQEPFTNGMIAYTSKTFPHPTALELDPSRPGIWVSDNGSHTVQLWDLFFDYSSPQHILLANNFNINEKQKNCTSRLCDTRGSIGIDNTGKLYVASSAYNQDVFVFNPPAFKKFTPGIAGTTINEELKIFSPPRGHNYLSSSGLFSPRGVVVKNNQLIVSDGYRILFWNDLSDIIKKRTNGKPAVGLASFPDFQGVTNYSGLPPYQRIRADNKNRLWVISNSILRVFSLPLSNGKQNEKIILFDHSIPILGGGRISWKEDDEFTGLDFDSAGNLWLAQPDWSRVIRIRNPFDSPQVDVILGQDSPDGSYCNRLPSQAHYNLPDQIQGAADNTLCRPGAVRVDKNNDIWVSDYSLEYHGNKRLLKFNHQKFENLGNSAFLGLPADFVSAKLPVWETAFDSKNRMALGFNGINIPAFPALYSDPMTELKSDKINLRIKDFFSHSYSLEFDQDDNLYVVDLNRGRLLIYLKPTSNLTNYYISPIPSSMLTLTPTSAQTRKCTGFLCGNLPTRIPPPNEIPCGGLGESSCPILPVGHSPRILTTSLPDLLGWGNYSGTNVIRGYDDKLHPMTVEITNLPPGLTFDPTSCNQTGATIKCSISGRKPAGAVRKTYYVNIKISDNVTTSTLKSIPLAVR